MIRRIPSGLLAGLFVVLAAGAVQAQQVQHGAGFAGQNDMTLNGGASVNGTFLQITDANGNEARTAFVTNKLPVGNFQTTFKFHILTGSAGFADGFGFCIQNQAVTQVGGTGGGMGYAGITPSIFIKFDIYQNVSTTQLYTNGAAPVDAGSTPMAPVDLHSLHDMNCVMTYDGTTLTVTTTDTNNNNTCTQTYPIDIPGTVGASTAWVGFTGGTGGENAIQEILTWTYSSLPAPTNLTATPGLNQIVLNWNAVAGATSYNILRAPTTGGPYTQIGTVNAPTTTYTDLTATYPGTYFYVVQAVQGTIVSLNSNEATGSPNQPPLWVSTFAIQTNENGATSTFNILINVALTAGNSITFTVTSSNGNEGQVSSSGQPPAPATSATSITFIVNGPVAAGSSIPVTVVGIDDAVADGPQPYTVTVSFTSTQVPPFGGFTIPPIQATNQDNDTPGITISRTSGLVTSESGGQDTFTVVLNTQPTAAVNMSLTSSAPTEATVAPASLQFTTTAGQAYNALTGIGGWNVAHVVTVTGVDDTILDQAQPFTIVTGPVTSADPSYNFAAPDVTGINLDNEIPPTLPQVWGSGCGLLGLEFGLPVLLAAALRRRRRNR